MDFGQLQLAKYLYDTARAFATRNNPMPCGLGVSLAQDAIELLAWTIVKEKKVPIKDKDAFNHLLDKIENATAISFPCKASMLELNAARVKFKHYGNLPLPGDATRLVQYAGECLREGMRIYFSIAFDSLSLADMITDLSIRERIKEAERHFEEGNFTQCISKCAEADLLISKPLDVLLPKVDRFGLREIGRLLDGNQSRALESLFEYTAKYMEGLRAVALAGLVNLEGRDYFKYKKLIPSAHQLMNGALEVSHKRSTYTQEEALFCLKYVTEVGLRTQQWISSV